MHKQKARALSVSHPNQYSYGWRRYVLAVETSFSSVHETWRRVVLLKLAAELFDEARCGRYLQAISSKEKCLYHASPNEGEHSVRKIVLQKLTE